MQGSYHDVEAVAVKVVAADKVPAEVVPDNMGHPQAFHHDAHSHLHIDRDLGHLHQELQQVLHHIARVKDHTEV
ncbi:Collagen alpha-1(XVIII) chain [Phytophthora palmivora]|uniref:Collagen alpha-1(XVIII) chain n=1 Tax=Phytophthora palmivora TaxID=4796 RepID=A0A2P4YJT6_9STRA|nr:Collagen alpha-1(XVIII) chain [Phytophthora palmivora]